MFKRTIVIEDKCFLEARDWLLRCHQTKSLYLFQLAYEYETYALFFIIIKNLC